MTQMLRLLPRLKDRTGGPHAPLVPDPHGTERSPQIRRIIGRKHVEIEEGTWGWQPTGKVETLAYHHDLAKAVQDGDLIAADEETAKACRVTFDPKFLGDYTADEVKKAFEAAKPAKKDPPKQPEKTGGKAEG